MTHPVSAISFHACSEGTAKSLLSSLNYQLEAAVDAFYVRGGGGYVGAKPSPSSTRSGRRTGSSSGGTTSAAAARATEAKLNALFDTYADAEDPDAILVEGTERLCADLEVAPDDVAVLVLAYHLQCPRMCEFRRAGWLAGWTALGCDGLPAMRRAVAGMAASLNDPDRFKDVYRFAFGFAKGPQGKSLVLPMAIAVWELLLRGRYPELDLWTTFLVEQHGKAISKDTWNLFLDFTRTAKPGFPDHDTDGAWPILIDQFVEYAREHVP
ncbi:hypothetical protein CXG81DRAFT_12940 [Caulochytrium protostelioides]|uniref:Defective in cullin neddylation protein n=1 Tax=Caulochytrium protostelioides TaxID=1555241 RepID=A0A4P9X678_9FUNG|nr:hypothetical protein CXG81DRAFT_12940 [Caulochytrium protostelioides]|eukprot:RKP00652.1 hypothetical protein CXG81DRAFT_12940 [Caulochytrium protostelioides]